MLKATRYDIWLVLNVITSHAVSRWFLHILMLSMGSVLDGRKKKNTQWLRETFHLLLQISIAGLNDAISVPLETLFSVSCSIADCKNRLLQVLINVIPRYG